MTTGGGAVAPRSRWLSEVNFESLDTERGGDLALVAVVDDDVVADSGDLNNLHNVETVAGDPLASDEKPGGSSTGAPLPREKLSEQVVADPDLVESNGVYLHRVFPLQRGHFPR